MNRAAACLRTASVVALLATVSACGPDDPNAFAPDCVPVGILGPAADLSSFAGPSRDLDTLVTRASIAGVQGTCRDAGKGRALATQLSVTIGIMRGPADMARHVTIPYFVAVLHGDRIVAKHALSIEADFPANVDRLALRSAPLDLTLPISRRMSSASYRLEVGLQLTPAQLAYNRAHPPQ